MRLFTAIDLPEEKKLELEEVSKSAGAYRNVNRENFHVTLNFLGEVEENNLSHILNICRKSATERSSFGLKFNSIVIKRDMLWAVPEYSSQLLQLQSDLAKEFVEARLLEPEKRTYSPHVKIGFVDGQVEPVDVNLCFSVTEFTLFRTHFNAGGGVEYESIARFRLKI